MLTALLYQNWSVVQSHRNTWLPHFDYVHSTHSTNVSEQNTIISQDETNTLFGKFNCVQIASNLICRSVSLPGLATIVCPEQTATATAGISFLIITEPATSTHTHTELLQTHPFRVNSDLHMFPCNMHHMLRLTQHLKCQNLLIPI